ncbi:MAG: hypothetical protein OXH76_23075, partial [Boseongicola sp.]|nr:hypothetical protein [Boseongicola sp.]
PVTRIFLGWFGPRGLATAVFALPVFDRLEPGSGDHILLLAVNAVWISTILHGVSAARAARWYARQLGQDGQAGESECHDALEGTVGSVASRRPGTEE